MLDAMVRGVWMLAMVAACGGAPPAVATKPTPRDESALVTRPSQLPEPVAEIPPAPQPATTEEIHNLVTEVPPPAVAGEKLPMVFDDPKPAVRARRDDRCADNIDYEGRARDLASQGSYAAALAKFQIAYLCDPRPETVRWLVLTACRARNYAVAKHYFKNLAAKDQNTLAQACMPPSFASTHE